MSKALITQHDQSDLSHVANGSTGWKRRMRDFAGVWTRQRSLGRRSCGNRHWEQQYMHKKIIAVNVAVVDHWHKDEEPIKAGASKRVWTGEIINLQPLLQAPCSNHYSRLVSFMLPQTLSRPFADDSLLKDDSRTAFDFWSSWSFGRPSICMLLFHSVLLFLFLLNIGFCLVKKNLTTLSKC